MTAAKDHVLNVRVIIDLWRTPERAQVIERLFAQAGEAGALIGERAPCPLIVVPQLSAAFIASIRKPLRRAEFGIFCFALAPKLASSVSTSLVLVNLSC